MNNFVTLHLHSDVSLCDSATQFKDYINLAVELGQKAIAFTEHGKPMQWVSKKLYCDKMGIKYIHGVECYLTKSLNEKVRDNYHTILLARNHDGVLEINKAISMATQPDHYYYVPRLSFDEFLKLSDNVIALSACVSSPLHKLDDNDPYFEKLINRYDYLEIQPHIAQEQKDYNVQLAFLSKQYHKPLVATSDVHSLNQYKAECRDILIWDKQNRGYDESEYDMTFKSYDQMVASFRNQDALPENVWMEAIDNTNVIADSVESWDLDRELKYPILYGSREKDEEKFKETVQRKFKEKLDNGIISPEQKAGFEKAIEEETRVFHKVHMEGFMLSESEAISWGKEQGYSVGFGRGSVCGSRIAYVTDITDVNPETWHTVFSRFCNEDRVEVGDIDVDVVESERPHFFNYVIDRFTPAKTARVPTFGTIQNHGVIECICRGLRNKLGEKGKERFTQDYINQIEKDFDSYPDAARKKYADVFKYYDGLVDVKVSQSVHAAGIVISPITLADNYGIFDKDGLQVMMIDMDEIHDVGLVKYDFLVLRNVTVIRDAYRMLGQGFPKSHEIDWNDQAVWKDMLRSPIGIFQMESPYAFSLLKKFEPHSIFDMSLVTAAVRPSGASYRDDLMKHILHKNPSPIIDDLLKDNLGYLVYQEDTIRFLQEICGLSGSEADNVRRAIGRKQLDRLQAALPGILEGYCKKSSQPREIAEKEASEFLKIIEDSAEYQFGYNHSIAYCMLGYVCAYLRYYHPGEFVASLLANPANMDDVAAATELAQFLKIPILPPKYGHSKGSYSYDSEQHAISKGIGSIKYLNESGGDRLFELAHCKKFDYLIDLLNEIKNQRICDSRQIGVLLKIDYFSNFCNMKTGLEILRVLDFFKYGDVKSISRDSVTPETEKIYDGLVNGKTKSGADAARLTILDMNAIFHRWEDYIKEKNYPDFTLKEKMANQIEYLGYCDLVTGKEEDRRKLLVTDVIPLKSKKSGEIWNYMTIAKSIGSGKESRWNVRPGSYEYQKYKKGDIIYCKKYSEKKAKNGDKYLWLDVYEILHE